MDLPFDPFAYTFLSLICALLIFKILAREFVEKLGMKKYHPIAGTILNQLINFNRLHHYMTDLAGKYKTYRLISPFRNEIYTSDPANVEYILKTNFDNYGKEHGWYNYTILKDLLGDGIFAVDGEKWCQQRKVSSHEFSTKITFGVELDSICGSTEEGRKFSNAFDDSSAMTLWRYVDIFWKIKKLFNIGSEAELKKNIKVVDDFVYKLIQSKKEKICKSKVDVDIKKDDILSRFLLASDTDPKYLREIILNFIVAGKDTSAAVLSWFIYMLCKHPTMQERIAQEIKEATNMIEIKDYAVFAGGISEEALEKMQYLHAALTETLRLYPTVPVDAKICASDDIFPDGYSVKKGDMVAYQPYAMGRMKFIWGEDAEDFKPERWLDNNGIFQQESPFKFTAFQAGPRICLGKEFAYRQMKIFAAVLLLGSFVFRMSDNKKAVNYRTMINLHIDGGLHVRAYHRSGGSTYPLNLFRE